MTGDDIVEQAALRLGAREQPMGSNRGPVPDACNAQVGAPLGSPWCAAFACTMAARAGVVDGPSTPSTGAIHAWGARQGRLISGDPLPGDFGLVRDPNSATGFCHTTIVARVLPLGVVSTIEGNEGDQVKRGLRHRSGLVFVRPYAA